MLHTNLKTGQLKRQEPFCCAIPWWKRQWHVREDEREDGQIHYLRQLRNDQRKNKRICSLTFILSPSSLPPSLSCFSSSSSLYLSHKRKICVDFVIENNYSKIIRKCSNLIEGEQRVRNSWDSARPYQEPDRNSFKSPIWMTRT